MFLLDIDEVTLPQKIVYIELYCPEACLEPSQISLVEIFFKIAAFSCYLFLVKSSIVDV